MKKHGLIEPAASPWASNILLVRKKDGTLRFCVDYRQLNAITYKDSYPLPLIDNCLNALAGSSWFSTLDLRAGYYNIQSRQRQASIQHLKRMLSVHCNDIRHDLCNKRISTLNELCSMWPVLCHLFGLSGRYNHIRQDFRGAVDSATRNI